jgi:type III secretion protein I
MEITQSGQALVTSLDELKQADPAPEQMARFEASMSEGGGGLGDSLLNRLSELKNDFSSAKQNLENQMASPGDDPASLMQMQWSLMRITMQEELIAKTVGKMSQNVETLLKTQ